MAQIKIDKLSNYTFITKLYVQISNTKCILHIHIHTGARSHLNTIGHTQMHYTQNFTDTDTLIQIRQHTDRHINTEIHTQIVIKHITNINELIAFIHFIYTPYKMKYWQD